MIKNYLHILLVILFAFGFRSTTSAQESNLDTITSYSNSTLAMKTNYIPDSVFLMKNLKSIIITGMDCDWRETDENGVDITQCWSITEFPSKISQLKQLEILGLSLNSFPEIPPEISELKNLRFINFTDCMNIQDIAPLTDLVNLEELFLYGCRISILPADIGRLTNLKELGLVGNPISEEEQIRVRKALPNCAIVF